MAYEGELLLYCPVTKFDFTQTYAVEVSGGPGNQTCGHLILNLGGVCGKYFHIAGLYHEPLMMDETGYQRYLKENGKKEIKRVRINITNPEAATLKLYELTSKKWVWGWLVHNCVGFVANVVHAGGNSDGFYWNCPHYVRFQ